MASVRASGSGRAAISSRLVAIAAARAGVRARRSRMASVPLNAARSLPLASSSGATLSRKAVAAAVSALLRCASGASANTRAAARAACPAIASQVVAAGEMAPGEMAAGEMAFIASHCPWSGCKSSVETGRLGRANGR